MRILHFALNQLLQGRATLYKTQRFETLCSRMFSTTPAVADLVSLGSTPALLSVSIVFVFPPDSNVLLGVGPAWPAVITLVQEYYSSLRGLMLTWLF